MMIKNSLKNSLKKSPALFKVFQGIYHFIANILAVVLSFFLRLFDTVVPKSENIWIFPVHFFIHTFSDNIRAVYEQVKDDRSIIKIILTRNKPVEISGNEHTIILRMKSFKAFWYVIKSKVIFLQHSVWLDLAPLHLRNHLTIHLSNRRIINLWHGIAIKSIAAESTGINNPVMNREKKHYIITASSFNDKMVMSTAFYPVDPKNVIVTGLARNDFILTDEHKLPNYCKEQLNSLRKLVGGKKLIIYAPTYREINLGGRNYEFSENEILQLKELLLKHNAILGLRLHYYNRNLSYENMIDNIFFFDLDQTLLPDMAMIIREATLVITDYSALFVDTLYSGKDVISFAYDYDSYGSKQRGFTYPLEAISPFPVCKIFDDLIENMNRSLNGDTKEFRSKYSLAKKFFFKYNDANNSKRVVEHIKQHLLKH